MPKTTFSRVKRRSGSGMVQACVLITLVGAAAIPSFDLFGQSARKLMLDPSSSEAMSASATVPQLTQHAAAFSGSSAARVASHAAAKLVEVSAKLDSLGDVADVAHYARVPSELRTPYFNSDVTQAMRLRPATGSQAPGFDLIQKVAKSLQEGLSPESIAQAASGDRTVRFIADVIEDVRRNYGAAEFDAFDIRARNYWDWSELDHVLHYVAQPLEPYARWGGPGREGWLRGQSAGRFALADGAQASPLLRRLQTYRKLFETNGVSDEVRHAAFPEIDEATRREVRVLQNKQESLRAQVEGEELQELAQSMRYLSPEIVATIERLLGGNSDKIRAQRALLLAALAGDIDIAQLTPSQLASRVQNRAKRTAR